MIRFHMVDVIPLLPIEQPQSRKSSYNILCPHCDAGRTRNGHLNINLTKDVFRCPRCGFSGGVLDLYGFYANVSREEAIKAIREKLNISDQSVEYKRRSAWKEPVIKEYPPADIGTRDATYRALLSNLTLSSDHMRNLLNRGLTEQVIAEKSYRTTPVVGWRSIAKRLRDDGLYLSGVPGFFREKDGHWAFAEVMRGILIPVRDSQGRIQGLQVRRDNAERRKFRWISTNERQDGCKAEGWTHLAGEAQEEILLIEGPMKADVVNHLTGRTALAVPGVNSLTQLQSSLTELSSMGVRRVMTCFDMDMIKNPYVQNGYSALLNLLGSMEMEFGTYLWNPHYNGLDDYLWKYCLRHGHRHN